MSASSPRYRYDVVEGGLGDSQRFFTRSQIDTAKSSEAGPSRRTSSRTSKAKTDEFQVGDAVYVDVGEERTPQVAVIIAFAEDGTEEEESEEENGSVGVTCEVRWFRWPDETRLNGAGYVDKHEILYVNVEPKNAATSSRKGKEPTPAEGCIASISADDIIRTVEVHGSRIGCEGAIDDLDGDEPAFTWSRNAQSPSLHLATHLYCERAIDPHSESVVPFDWEALLTAGVDEQQWDVASDVYEDRESRAATPRASSLAWVEVVSPIRSPEERRRTMRRERKPRQIWSPSPDVPKPRTFGKKAGIGATSTPVRPKPAAAPRRRWQRPAPAPTRRRARPAELDSDDATSESDSDSDSDSSESDSDDDDAASHYSDGASTAATSDHEMEAATDNEDDADEAPRTPSRKRKAATSTPRTPRRKRRAMAATTLADGSTPTRSHVLAMQPALPALPSQAPKMTSLSLEELSTLTPQARAKRLLHVGATPERLPGREQQYDEVLACVQDAVDAGIGGCVYVSGVPGQGKTATVREVIRALGSQAEAGEIAPFHFVEINGMKLPDPSEAYSLLWSAIHGGEYSSRARLAPKAALKALTAHFNRGEARDDQPTTVVLMDEMDVMIDARQEVIYNLFDWPNRAGSRLIVIAVANNMTLPESALTPKVASRLGMERITFMSYSHQELETIVKTRLGLVRREELDGEALALHEAATAGCGDVIADFAIQLVCKRVANVNGDARRVLDILRRAIELVEGEAARRAKSGGDGKVEQVQASHIIAIYNSFLKTPSTIHVRALPLHAKVLLHSLLTCMAKTGGDGAPLADVLAHHASVCQMHALNSHLARVESPTTSALPAKRGQTTQPSSLSPELAPCIAQLSSLGLVRAEGGAAGLCGAVTGVRLVLRGAPEDVGTALANDADRRIKKIVGGR